MVIHLVCLCQLSFTNLNAGASTLKSTGPCSLFHNFDLTLGKLLCNESSFSNLQVLREVYDGEAVIPASWITGFNVASGVTSFFGAFACTLVSDNYGRRIGLAGGIIFAAGGIVGEITSTTRVAFLMSKMILGFSLGFYLTIGPLYCSELSPVILRGITTAGVNLGIVLGQLLSNAVVKGFGERTDRWAYRAPFAFQFFFVGKQQFFKITCRILKHLSFLNHWSSLCARITLVPRPSRPPRRSPLNPLVTIWICRRGQYQIGGN